MKFGNWEFNEENLTLTHTGKGGNYEIDLEDCTTSAKVLDWIFQIEKKTWASTADLGELVRAFATLLDPQSSLCGEGNEGGPIDVRNVIEQNQKLRSLLKE